MGKKKKGGGKKKAGAEDDGELNPDGLAAKMLFAENFSLKRQLAERREDALLAISQRKQLQAQIEDLKRDFEREEKSTYAITADMTRQYKDMQGELIKRINGAENTITEFKDQLELQRVAYEELKREKDRAVAAKETEIVELKTRIDELCAEFGDMLKGTLEKMSERINITNSNFQTDLSTSAGQTSTVPMEEKLQEYHLKK